MACKILREELQNDPAARTRFFYEAKLQAALSHPGVPAVYELGELADARPFFTMELIRGETLADLQHRPVSEADVELLPVFHEVCCIVAYAHSQKVIHRDLKPANIMIDQFGQPRIMDWGLAKRICGAAGEPPLPLTAGTPNYMAPELLRGDGGLDERTDVFSLGAILYELLTGKHFRREDYEEIYDTSDPADELRNLARYCLAPVERRLKDAQAVEEQLRGILG